MKIKVRLNVDGNVEDLVYDSPHNLTYRERRLIREVTGLAGIDWITAVNRIDDDVVLGLAAVALHRDHRFPGVDEMLDMTIESVGLIQENEDDEEEGRGGPPAEAEAEEAAPAKSRKTSGASAK